MKLRVREKNQTAGIISFFMLSLILFSACSGGRYKQADRFVYGMMPSTESFYNVNGEVMGYAALFCEWLSDLFGIQFKPEVVERDSLLTGLASFDIDFTGVMTPAEERRKTYFMTSAITMHTVRYFWLADNTPAELTAESRPLRYALMENTITIDQVTSRLKPGTFEIVLAKDNETELMYSAERDGKFLWPETVLMADNSALISKLDFHNISLNEILYIKVGLIKDYGHTYLFREWFPDHSSAIEYETTLAAFDALDRGEVDAVMTSNHELLTLTNYLERTGFRTNFLFDNPFNSAFGFNKNEKTLRAIVGKALKMIDTKNISDQWMRRFYDYRRSLVKARQSWFMASSVLFLIMFSLFVILFIRSRRDGKRLEKLVSERTRALELQTAKLQAMFDSLPDIVFCKDLDLRYTQCNRITEEHNGVKETDIIGKNDIETSIFPADVAKRIMEADRSALREGRKFVVEETLPYFNGITRVLETVRAPLLQNGVIIGLIVIARDITERKKVERELQLQTTILTTLFDSIPDFIFAKDVNSCYMQCNKSYLAHLGFNREDIIGKNDIEGFKLDPELVEEYWVWDRKVINEGRRFILEERIPGANGTNPLYETVKAPLVLDGEVIGLLGISRDITKRKEMEEAALLASRSKSAFLANMSHEIRTPMNSIMGFSELAMDSETSPKTRDYLSKIQTNAEWLLQIINDILDISKIESGKMELESIPFNMHELFASCRTLIMPKADEKGITLQFYAEPSIGKMPLGDPTRLRQVILNLLSNAVKFTNAGTVKVLAEIKGKSEKTVTVRFEIKDSGIGMTKEQIEKIFDPFTQAETGTTRQYGGTGLGLSITKNIVELMGGELFVESLSGIGSKFSFTLTFDTIDAAGDNILGHNAALKEIEKPAFEGEVLLCEDNVMNQQVICEHLARVGLKTVVADNGKTGIEMIQNRIEKGEKPFDLIFMDMHMPVMDGLEASAKILGLKTGIPIVAMTANIMSSDLDIYRQSGMGDCIGKPFTSQELWRCLLKYLKPVNGVTVHRNAEKVSYAANSLLEADMEFQETLKKTFVKSNQNKFDEIVKALEAGDIKLAHRLAHTLKSNAGQIGITLLRKAAADVEYQLKDGENLVTKEQMALLETELNAALAQFAAFSPPDEIPVQPAQAQTLDAAAALELFEKLEPMLEMGNPESREFIGGLREIAGSETLIRQIEDFEFDPALVTLGNLKKNFGK